MATPQSLQGVLASIPGLGGYLAGQQNDQAMQMGQLQQVGALQGIAAKMQEQQLAQVTRDILAKSGGDPEVAMKAALTSGNAKVAESLVPMVKMAQEQRQKQETAQGMRDLYAPQGAAPASVGGAVDAPSVTGLTVPPGTPSAAPTATGSDPKAARIAQLQKMAVLYANNPAASTAIAREMDKRLSQSRWSSINSRWPIIRCSRTSAWTTVKHGIQFPAASHQLSSQSR